MVLLVNPEPSPILTYSSLPSLGTKGGYSFPHTPRFVRDGTNNQEKLPNFLNGQDGQGLELAAKHMPVDTMTHTQFKAPLMHGVRHTLDIAEQVDKGLWSAPALRSKAAKLATPQSLIANDTRYGHVKDPYAEPLGPGHYWTEGGLPNMGTLPKELPSRGCSPSRNPDAPSSSFQTTTRPDPFPPRIAPENWFMGTDMPIASFHAPWSEQSNKRVDVPSYRTAGRYSEAKKEIPYDAQYPAAEALTKTGDTACIGDKTDGRRKTHKMAASFSSTQPRLASLPRGRDNDMRLSRKYEDEDSKWLGPGAYTPLISAGGPKRKTYKLFNPQLTSSKPAGQLGARSTMNSRSLNAKSVNAKSRHSMGYVQPFTGKASSSSFSTTTRNHKYGPHTWSTDSALTRTV